MLHYKTSSKYFLCQVVVHEMGHNLGMSHDFDDKHAGKGCDGTGFMSYGTHPDQWSPCSKSDLLEHYNEVLQYAAQGSSISWCLTSNHNIVCKFIVFSNVSSSDDASGCGSPPAPTPTPAPAPTICNSFE